MKTEINREANNNPTVINTAVNKAGTVINSAVQNKSDGSLIGKVIAEKYSVVSRLADTAGEADLYLCEDDGMKYVAKIYRRLAAVKPEIVEALKTIDSPFISRTIEIGTYDGFPFEIMPYYAGGSMQGHIFSYKELKKRIIPDLNEALRVLHTHVPKIIHKDLKPSNIMLNDKGDVVLIDFGISSVVEGNNTIVSTKTGMTPEYSAPEALRNAFLEESDYYSLGVTLYELFCGHTPFNGMDAEQVAQYTVLQQFPFPDSFPADLRDLIRGLTYNDITHRHDKKNPNRRWAYDEVKNWCNGKKQPVPGQAAASELAMPPYTFTGRKYTTVHELVLAMAQNWEEGKKQLFRGLLSGFFKGFNPELAGICIDAEENTADKDDVVFGGLLYKIDPELKSFCWRNHVYEDLQSFGAEMIGNLRQGNRDNGDFWNDVLLNRSVSMYIRAVYPKEADLIAAVGAIEDKASNTLKSNQGDISRTYYTLAYLLSGDKTFQMNDNDIVFNSPDDVAEYMKELLDVSFEKFTGFCKSIIRNDKKLDPQFEAWLIALGKREELERWRRAR